MFKGSLVAMITPMHTDGTVDKKSLQEIVEWHIASKTEGLVVAGTTGESATLTHAEKIDLITTVIKQVRQRIPVIAGTGTNSTQSTIDLTLAAKALGVEGCLIVTPYYNRPTQNGLFEHYKAIADKAQIPIILYNVPTRTGCDLLPETVGRLAKVSNIVAIKEATGQLSRAQKIKELCDLTVLSGDDATALELMLNGAEGVISAVGNVVPRAISDLCRAARQGNNILAKTIDDGLRSLYNSLFLETNPIAIKWSLCEMGLIESGIRLPLLPLDAKFHQQVKEDLSKASELNY